MSYSPIDRIDTKMSGISRRSTFASNPFRRISSRWWFWEITSITITLLSFLAIIITLRVFDGKPLPEIPFGITLNTIASLLGTVVKTTLLLVVSSALSQLKWLWFHERERRLQDLQVYDEASRGPWGAMVLLRTSRFSLASLGALIVLFLLGFDPFIQQLITTPQRTLSKLEATTAIFKATSFNQSAHFRAFNKVDAGVRTRLLGKYPEIGVTLAVENAINTKTPMIDFAPACPSSNCTWSPFSTLSLCSKCVNVTDYARNNWDCQALNGTNRACTYKLPSSSFSYTYFAIATNSSAGLDIEGSGELRQRIWATRLNESTSKENAFQRVSRIVMEDGNGSIIPGFAREQVLQATECELSMCITQHNLSVQQGKNLQSRIGDPEQPFAMVFGPTTRITALPTYNDSSAIIRGQEYSIDGSDTLNALATAIEGTLIGNVTTETLNITSPDGTQSLDGGLMWTSDVNRFLYAELDFNTAMDNVATSVSSYMRSLSNDSVIGQSLSQETYIRVKWAWITFPAVLVFGGVLLLFMAIVETSKKGVEVWKYSCLPLLFHSVDDESARRAGDMGKRQMATVEEMEDEAKRIRVRLGKEEDGRGWSLQRQWREREMRQ
ncbi:hypothetical protein EG327_009243 [Venturia inaequalis]|uniref:Uncharacterized protein n=1 Tax=Venturia inaequalis TaxID=5025 RepID=A0A8H3YXC8_VENIN|nr:hypothetical protein EG327_009243 [Venturia inaequalis]